ncbi:acetate/propionate family kinase [Rhodanobacter umsongensis]|uniref:Acetate kinase n=1 Tax=Rhodanobacter umsongensis TaxID=633153 RepID=A0ABW0JNL3_9GAMM
MPDRNIGILALNAGSSSLKFGLYTVDGTEPVERVSGSMTSDGDQRVFLLDSPRGRLQRRAVRADSALQAIFLLGEMRELPPPSVIGHRIVHGGISLHQHARVDDSVLRQLDAASVFAPLHVPPALRLLVDAMATFPDATQIACLDTVFHNGMPDVSRVLPLPAALRNGGVERVGFHGLSCESVVRQLGRDCPSRIVIAHLGSGCSVTAVRDGCSVDTSMGLTPAGGVMMATRPGDIDPGILLYLLREGRYSIAALEDMFERQSGLSGVSGTSADARELLAQSATQPMAALALAQFTRSVARHIAGMIVALGGIDLLVFTGGIGEHALTLRADILNQLAPLVCDLAVRVVPARENDCIAQHAWKLARH